MPAEPRWLSLDDVLIIHSIQLTKFGGLEGVKDAGGVESAVFSPVHLFHYQDEEDLLVLAVKLCAAIAGSQHFNDGNKRTAAVTMIAFLEANGYTLDLRNDLSLALLVKALINHDITAEEFEHELSHHIIGLGETSESADEAPPPNTGISTAPSSET